MVDVIPDMWVGLSMIWCTRVPRYFMVWYDVSLGIESVYPMAVMGNSSRKDFLDEIMVTPASSVRAFQPCTSSDSVRIV